MEQPRDITITAADGFVTIDEDDAGTLFLSVAGGEGEATVDFEGTPDEIRELLGSAQRVIREYLRDRSPQYRRPETGMGE